MRYPSLPGFLRRSSLSNKLELAQARRRFLRLLLALGAMLPSRAFSGSEQPVADLSRRIEVLGAYLDRLIPADSTPSATELGVDTALLEEARSDSNLAILIIRGCQWLDREATKTGATGFLQLSQAKQDRILATAERSPEKSIAGHFFAITRDRALNYYYSHPKSWIGLGYDGPPQPVGFPDHERPPARVGYRHDAT